MALNGADSSLNICDGLTLGDFTYEDFAILREGDD
jgi:hypothetical protein